MKNLKMRQTEIQNVRRIAKLENQNQSLEAQVMKLQSDSQGTIEQLAEILASKDSRIEELILET